MARVLKRGRPKGSKDGDGAAQPKPFRIVKRNADEMACYVGGRAWPLVGDEAFITAPAIVRILADGSVEISGEGVARERDRTIRVTA